MSEKPQLVMTNWVKGEPFAYKCSLCGQTFLLPEDRTPKEAMAEVLAAFNDHCRKDHQDVAS